MCVGGGEDTVMQKDDTPTQKSWSLSMISFSGSAQCFTMYLTALCLTLRYEVDEEEGESHPLAS